jgi:hypothetical protein
MQRHAPAVGYARKVLEIESRPNAVAYGEPRSKFMTDGRMFSDVDNANNPLELVAAMRTLSGHAWFQAVKRHAFEVLQVQPGNVVMDVGCGVGQDVLALGRLVGPTGRVVGMGCSM